MREFLEKIANTALLPTREEFWELVKEAKEILKEQEYEYKRIK